MHKLIIAAALLAATSGSATAQSLPGGASSLNETHGDWRVVCANPGGVVRCAMLQSQVRGENRQRLLMIELMMAQEGMPLAGSLVLPFGLKLDSGVALAIDNNELLPAVRFSTCLTTGCIVPLAFNADSVAAMRAGKALTLKATANDSGQELQFSISLKGFASALGRVTQLAAN